MTEKRIFTLKEPRFYYILYQIIIWFSIGKNKISEGVRNMVEEIFQQGQKTRPVIAADVVVLIQEKKMNLDNLCLTKGSFIHL